MRTLHEILTDLNDGKLVDGEESSYAAPPGCWSYPST